ncbi:hypothetical protein Agabi119p4_7140 [Agaricus bisporus var. burnettii]|uniref:DUF427 domain-containing protein n=1 Tax=Agaricus bisporus var. burnettii TaxID=192524 RepID=A0A8H7C724_AGABI|nr:hypothetical protein Agabi119p4_7140 [Agaricus bisporus var. burnettii]
MLVKVSLHGHALAESDKTIVIEGNHYFPPDSIHKSRFHESKTHTTCPWKGKASYYNAKVDGEEVSDIAWYYPSTITDEAKSIENYVAFYKNKVSIQEYRS